ncbi:flotillin domain-containing protein [Clavibacter tessellarius]|uniref:flotillin domain-containing protein n=1 Tax=Clavibacter tessellarius TaxID=31965 RepID=UPI003254A789
MNEAASITALGKANADAIQARGQAEAEAAAALAEAQNKLSREALQARIIASMPEIAREMAAPLANVDNMTIISADGANALNRSVAENMATLPKLLKDTTGIDVATALSTVPRLDGRGRDGRRRRYRHGRGPGDGRVRGRRDLIPMTGLLGAHAAPGSPA